MVKTCKKCGLEKELSEFIPTKANKDGRAGSCRACNREYRNSRRTPETAKKQAEWWERNREKQRAYQAAYRARNTLQCQARRAVGDEIRAGRMAPPAACECNDCRTFPATELHHESYEQDHWLDVVPLCTACHKIRHRTQLTY